MKSILSLIALSLLSNFALAANEIDNLKTSADLNRFLEKRFPNQAQYFSLDESKIVTSEYGKNKFYKLDLDVNGRTDLLIDGRYFFAITEDIDLKYEIHLVDRGAFELYKYTLANIVYEDNLPLLKINSYSEGGKEMGNHTATILMKFGGFIEYNQKPDHIHIDELNFSTDGCFGTCPIFDLTIAANGIATYDAKGYNKQEGKFAGRIDQGSLNRLFDTINYMGLNSLKSTYSVPWTDDRGGTLEIKYDGGKTKKIVDYGMIGTFGLKNLYDQLAKLRDSQKWTKSPRK